MKKPNIPFIHNYCDRWCERCPLSSRCAVFEEEAKLSPESKDINNDAFWERLNANFQKTLDMLREMAEDLGIDIDEAKAEQAENNRPGPALAPAADDEIESPKSEKARDIERLERASRRYIKLVDRFFDHDQDLFETKQRELEQRIELDLPIDEAGFEGLAQAFEVIRFYQFFISAKMTRAFSSVEYEGEFYDQDFDPVINQVSDGNGSAKIAVIAIERSMGAWEIVRQHYPEKTDELIDLFAILQRLKKGLLAILPLAMTFVRPGFDDPEFADEMRPKAAAEA